MGDLYLLKNALRDLVRPKRVAAVLVLGLLPAVVAGLWRVFAGAGASSRRPCSTRSPACWFSASSW